MYGKIIDGVFHKAPYTYTIGGVTIDNFDHDIPLMTELGYKEVVTVDIPIDTRFRYVYTYEERDGKIYESRELDTSKELLDDLKARRIAQTKEDLASYLKDNPLVSTCKGGIEKEYTVTLDKQTQLFMKIVDHIINPNSKIEWNALGEVSEEWTYEEICQLKNEITNYVTPIVEYQRKLEDAINKLDNQEAIYNLDCYFNKDKFTK